MTSRTKAELLLSTDTLSGYGLDLIFQIASQLKFDGIDLAVWKNFDAWNIEYVKKLSQKYLVPVKVIQVSDNVNKKELDYAVDLANEVGADVITINAPEILNFKAAGFITGNLKAYKSHHSKIKFSIINPPRSSMLLIPLPKYNFNNVVDIIKKYGANLGLDISNMDESILESNFLRKMGTFIPYIPVIYISDKNKSGVGHIPLGEGVLKLDSIFKKVKQNEYFGYMSLKIEISKKDLLDLEKVEQILKKCRNYYKDSYEDLEIKL